ncbi:MAG TPA: replication-relaxation family protein [Micromonosporaceae bacterium]|nr:replication-relaxation family protein [Micromonosporaceae bacterium]
MGDRSYVTRLRASGGPSHDLLVLLHKHRVMTTGQLARATAVPERTIRYRLDRLHTTGLVECVRPGREAGSAPRHWWLRPTGARLVAGTATADGRPSGMFVAHAAAITEVWLALTEHGHDEGIHIAGWLTDRTAWQEWDRVSAWSTHPYRLTPDAAATLTVDGAACVVFIEVDLASMTQTLLKQKVARYLAYADDRAWEGRHPHCPPMLLLTTTATRAASFIRAAGPILARQGQTIDASDPAAALVVAACGLVRDPARAITEACWSQPDTAAAELTLAELLSERLDAQAASHAWRIEQDTVVRRRTAIDALGEVQRFPGLADRLGSQPAAEALQLLIADGAATFLDNEPDLANQVADWLDQRRRINRFRARDLAQPIVCELEQRHTNLWVDQAHRLLTAEEHLTAAHPRLYRLAARLASGHLADLGELAILATPPTETREQIQHVALGDYPIRRAAAVNCGWQALNRRERRRTSLDQLGAAYDDAHLSICGVCGIAEPQPEPDEVATDRCAHCDGVILDWPQRTTSSTLAEHLELIRRHLDEIRGA